MLDQLPNEVLSLIVAQAASSTLKNLAEVSKRFHDIATPYLYESVLISIAEPSNHPKIQSQIDHLPSRCLKFTKNLWFKATIDSDTWNQCSHGKSNSVLNLGNVLSSLAEDNLRSFRWDLGSCIPTSLMYGYLPNKQNSVEEISLITNGYCANDEERERSVDLTWCETLQSLSWKSLGRFEDFNALRDCLRVTKKVLRKLELDFIEWQEAESNYHVGLAEGDDLNEYENFFMEKIIEVDSDEARCHFPNLEHLSLTYVDFWDAGQKFLCAFNFKNLRVLKLRNCSGGPIALQGLQFISQGMRLKSLELLILRAAEAGQIDEAVQSICSFLDSFQGLEDFYLALDGASNWLSVALAASNHIATLRRLVTQELIEDEEMMQYGLQDPTSGELETFYEKSNLVCVGFNHCPHGILINDLEMALWRGRKRLDWKMIHFRKRGGQCRYKQANLPHYSSPYGPPFGDCPLATGDDLNSDELENIQMFANWAFGPMGLHQLQIIAMGDFSHEGRYSCQNLLLCRNSGTGVQKFRYLGSRESDPSMWKLVEDNMDMLAACPMNQLIEAFEEKFVSESDDEEDESESDDEEDEEQSDEWEDESDSMEVPADPPQ